MIYIYKHFISESSKNHFIIYFVNFSDTDSSITLNQLISLFINRVNILSKISYFNCIIINFGNIVILLIYLKIIEKINGGLDLIKSEYI